MNLRHLLIFFCKKWYLNPDEFTPFIDIFLQKVVPQSTSWSLQIFIKDIFPFKKETFPIKKGTFPINYNCPHKKGDFFPIKKGTSPFKSGT